jgi:hypothetical protein
MLIGRKKEKAVLDKLLASDNAEFLVVYGRRRVGKTYLIKEHFGGRFAFYTTGVPENQGAGYKDQLANFADSLKRYGLADDVRLKNWSEAFAKLRDLLESIRTPDKKVVFIDELPWFDTPKSGFLSAFDYFWNSWASARGDVLLIACGSAASWMTNKILRNSGGLHNRVTMRMHISPFTLGECEAYYAAKGIVVSRYQIVENYMIMGGIPYYLNLMDPMLSAAANIDNLFFGKDALLEGEYDVIYRSLFKDSDLHIKIIETLCKKNSGLCRMDIQNAVKQAGGSLSRALQELELSGFIRSYTSFAKKERGTIYQLIDPYTLFYFDHIRGNNDEHYWQKYVISPSHGAWSGYAFELVCLLHADMILTKTGAGYVIANTWSWRSGKKKGGVQVDLIIDRSDGIIDLCEMKSVRREYRIDEHIHNDLIRKKDAFHDETGTRKGLRLVIVTTYGLVQNEYTDDVQQVVTMDDLFG